jgi:hypothetical protein
VIQEIDQGLLRSIPLSPGRPNQRKRACWCRAQPGQVIPGMPSHTWCVVGFMRRVGRDPRRRPAPGAVYPSSATDPTSKPTADNAALPAVTHARHHTQAFFARQIPTAGSSRAQGRSGSARSTKSRGPCHFDATDMNSQWWAITVLGINGLLAQSRISWRMAAARCAGRYWRTADESRGVKGQRCIGCVDEPGHGQRCGVEELASCRRPARHGRPRRVEQQRHGVIPDPCRAVVAAHWAKHHRAAANPVDDLGEDLGQLGRDGQAFGVGFLDAAICGCHSPSRWVPAQQVRSGRP